LRICVIEFSESDWNEISGTSRKKDRRVSEEEVERKRSIK